MASNCQVKLIDVRHERWALENPFVISRGAKTAADVVIVEVGDDLQRGRGEAVPYGRYGETVDGVIDDVRNYEGPLDRIMLLKQFKAGAARNALDCALWDLSCKEARSMGKILLSFPVEPVETAYTISLDSAEGMAQAAVEASELKLLKLKLGGEGDEVRMRKVREARPDARLIGDANEAWPVSGLEFLLSVAAKLHFELIEQPLPARDDAILQSILRPVAVCADESVHTADDLAQIVGKYDAVNIKLDKAGGLTEALRLRDAAREAGMRIMVGSMVATSLGVAPALCLAQGAEWVDLDGPLLLAKDRPHGLEIQNGKISPPEPALWG